MGRIIHNRGTTSLFLPPPLLKNNPRIDHRLCEFFTEKITEGLLHELVLQFNTSTDKKWSLCIDQRSTTCYPYPTAQHFGSALLSPLSSHLLPASRGAVKSQVLKWCWMFFSVLPFQSTGVTCPSFSAQLRKCSVLKESSRASHHMTPGAGV